MDTTNNKLCIGPFGTVSIVPNGEYLFCCRNPKVIGNVHDTPIQELWNSDYLVELRRSMLAGEEHPDCSFCWDIEKTPGTYSWRREINNRYPESFDEMDLSSPVMEFKVFSLEVSFSNLCNLACRMCAPTVSTTLNTKWKTIPILSDRAQGPVLNKSFEDPVELINTVLKMAPNLKQVYISGGEPLMETHFVDLITALLPWKDTLVIALNSNFMKLKHGSIELLDTLNQFKHVYMSASLDGVGAVNDLIRECADFDVVTSNIKEAQEKYPNIEITVTTAIQALNLFNLPQLLEYVLTEINPKYYAHSIVVNPSYLSIQNLPAELKEQARYIFDEMRAINEKYNGKVKANYYAVSQYIQNVETVLYEHQLNEWPKFLEFNKALDKSYGKDIFTVVPQLAKYNL